MFFRNVVLSLFFNLVKKFFMSKNIEVWSPISISNVWLDADTSLFDDLAPSWYKKRKEFEEGQESYDEFLTKLKRQHAIETGVVEKLYDLTEGITQTLIKNGFVESYIGHNDTNIPPKKLMQFLHDHFEAMDFIFDLVKSNRNLSKSFIKELHQLITQNQDFTEAIDTFGKRISVKLLKGEFKKHDNNPKREDGTTFLYCPPIQVEQEIDNLIAIYNDLSTKKINPIIIASWLHHAFTQIHPFQDGNGRIARLLASLILIKNGLLPFTVKRGDKVKYIKALENADKGNPQDLVSFFALEQKKSIEAALNFKTEKKINSLHELASIFNEKVSDSVNRIKEERKSLLNQSRNKVFENIYDILGEIKNQLHEFIPKDKAIVGIQSCNPESKRYYYHTHQIAEYANNHDYFFNRNLPRGWFGIYFTLPNGRKFNLILSIHHYGYDDDVIAVGTFIEYSEPVKENFEEKTSIPINLEPFTISLETINSKTSTNLKDYINDVVKVGLTIIINEIN